MTPSGVGVAWAIGVVAVLVATLTFVEAKLAAVGGAVGLTSNIVIFALIPFRLPHYGMPAYGAMALLAMIAGRGGSVVLFTLAGSLLMLVGILYLGYLAAVKEQNGAAMSLGRTSTFLDIYFDRDLATFEKLRESPDGRALCGFWSN